jgi:hypothetical protein
LADEKTFAEELIGFDNSDNRFLVFRRAILTP